MAAKRCYADGCASAHALDIIGERWALLVARELMLGPKRFTDLRSGLPSISPNVLTQRLEKLEEAGVLRRRRLAPPAASWVYELTEWGQELEPVIQALGRWGARSPTLPMGAPLSIDAVMLSLRTMFDSSAADDFRADVELRVGEHTFAASVAAGELRLERASLDHPDAVVHASACALVSLVYGGRKLAEAVKSGDIQVEGDRAAVSHFLSLFPLPERADLLDEKRPSVVSNRPAPVRRMSTETKKGNRHG